MKSIVRVSILALSCILLMSGCTYKGRLKSGFYNASQNGQKMPLKAAVILSPSFEAGVFDTKNVYYAHSAKIKTHPALSQGMIDLCQSVFGEVTVVQFTSANSQGIDVLVVPNVEMKEEVITLSVALKSPGSGDVIREYQASGNLTVSAGAAVHTLGTINTVCCALLSPVTAPTITQIIGGRAKRELADRLSDCMHRVEEQIRNDPFVAKKLKP